MRLPELGVGIIYWPQIESILTTGDGLVNVIEVEPQSFWYKTQSEEDPYRIDWDIIERLKTFPQPKIIHGVGFPVGGSRPPDPRQLQPLLQVRDALEAPWISEHLSFNQAQGKRGLFNTGFFLPPLQTVHGVDAAAATIRQIAARLPVPFAFETGVNYLRPRPGELSDGAFMGAIAREADCGILLDLHNLWANQLNGRQPVKDFLAEIPLDRVWEVHLAGGFERDGYWLDAHSGEIPAPLFELAVQIIPTLPNLRAIIFEILPMFVPQTGLDVVRTQLEKMHTLWSRRRQAIPDTQGCVSVAGGSMPEATDTQGRAQVKGSVSAATDASVVSPQMIANPVANVHDKITPAQWEDTLAALVIGHAPQTPLSHKLDQDPGVHILRALASEFRAGMVVDALKLTSRLILLTRGEAVFRQLLNDFWKVFPPEPFESAEAEAFAVYLADCRLDIPYLDEVLAFERALIQALVAQENHLVRFRHDPLPLLQALREGRLPESVAIGNYEIEITSGPDHNHNDQTHRNPQDQG